MFLKERPNHKDYILSLFRRDEDCFEYFKEQCEQKGVHIASVTVEAKGGRFFKNVPYMCIFVTNKKDFTEYEVDFGTREMANSHTKEIILPIWHETCKRFSINIDDYYHPQMPIALGRMDFSFYNYFTREYKNEVSDIVVKETGVQPKYVFASSGGYITIVFSEERHETVEKYKTKIQESIQSYATAVAKELLGDIDLTPLSVGVYHTGMSIELYALSRED